MVTFLHVSFRVKNPFRSAALYAELLEGRVVDIGGPLDSIGVKGGRLRLPDELSHLNALLPGSAHARRPPRGPSNTNARITCVDIP